LECYPGYTADLDELAGYPTVYDSCEPQMVVNMVPAADTSNLCSRIHTRTYTTAGTMLPGCAVNTVTYTQTLTVSDSRPPVVTSPLEFHAECSAVPTEAATQPSARDGCGNVVTVTLASERELQGECSGTYTLLREYRVADSCANSRIHTVIVDVEDTTPPVFQTAGGVQPSSVTVVPNGCPPTFAVFTVADACALAPEVVFTQDVRIIRSEENLYDYVAQQEISASDPCGNTDTRVYQYVVEGNPLVYLELDGPNAAVAKTANFNVDVRVNVTNGCPSLQNTFIVAVDVGAAVLQSTTPAGSCTQRSNGVVYCENLPAGTPTTVTLVLKVPDNFLGHTLLLRAVSEYETQGYVVPASGNDRTALVRFL